MYVELGIDFIWADTHCSIAILQAESANPNLVLVQAHKAEKVLGPLSMGMGKPDT